MALISIRPSFSWLSAVIVWYCFVVVQGTKSDKPLQKCYALDPSPTLEPFVDKLTVPREIRIDQGRQVIIGAYKIKQKLHRDLPPTTLYAYGTTAATASVPGPTLIATEGVPSFVRWENHIHDKRHMLPVDYSIEWANPKHGGVPIVTHLHGAESESIYDGHPDAWYTAAGDHGPTFSTKNYTYANAQRPMMNWYHDHALGVTRLNVLAGLAGLYLTEPTKKSKDRSWHLKKGNFIPLVLADKQLFHNGSINFPNVGESPANHPKWCMEYFGDTILVNGKAWPYLRVRPQKYRLVFLNGGNARVFVLSLSHQALSFIQIGSDGGILHKPQNLKTLTVGHGERIDCIVDFSRAAGSEVVLHNSGAAPFPSGNPAYSPPSTSAVMKFIVSTDYTKRHERPVPAVLRKRDRRVDLNNVRVRQLSLVMNMDMDGNALELLLSNLTWRDPVTEKPVLGSTEIWEFINLTPDAHPMHIHLVDFKALNQQPFNLTAWQNGECEIFNATLETPRTCFTEKPIPPSANQIGWKDTIMAMPGVVTRIVMEWKSHDGGPFPFDATAGPGYEWHCHILDHEDNDMIRPFQLVKGR